MAWYVKKYSDNAIQVVCISASDAEMNKIRQSKDFLQWLAGPPSDAMLKLLKDRHLKKQRRFDCEIWD